MKKLWTDLHSNIHHNQMDELDKWTEHAKDVLDFWPIAYYPFQMIKTESGAGLEDLCPEEELKEQLIEHLKKRGIECKDYGTYTKDSCDYPVYAKKVAEAILSGECEEGILLCGTGIGMSMAANKIKGIRAALCSDCFSAQATKEHNNANVLCMGARVIGPELAFRIADTFLDSRFSNDERHIRRISMLED